MVMKTMLSSNEKTLESVHAIDRHAKLSPPLEVAEAAIDHAIFYPTYTTPSLFKTHNYKGCRKACRNVAADVLSVTGSRT